MIRYITGFVSLSIIGLAFFFFMNCVQQGPGTATGPGGAGGGEGFDPSKQTSHRRGEGFDPSQGTYYSTAGYSSSGNNNDPFHKSPSVQQNEKQWGASAPIGKAGDDEVDQEVLEDFLLGEKINNMDDLVDLRVYVKLKKTGSGVNSKTEIVWVKDNEKGGHISRNLHRKFYGGQVTIAYYDEALGRPRTHRLRSGTGNDAKYNVWLKLKKLNDNDKQIFQFHGFFQDIDGAVILVIDKKTPLARNAEDSTVNTRVGGSIWIMTFKTIFPAKRTDGNSCSNLAVDQTYIRHYNQQREPLSQGKSKCWFISNGPFDCRAWRLGNGVNTLRRLEPDNNCYTKLGEFSGLDVLKAFGVNKLGDL